MRSLLYTTIRLCLIGMLFIGTDPSVRAQIGPQEKGFNTELQARLQQVLNDFVNSPTSPYVGGLSVAIKVDDLAFWKGADGYASRAMDLETYQPLPYGYPFTEDLSSRIYSVTKTFTAALTLELVKEGTLSLDVPISTYLENFKARFPKLNDVTIHQLLAHETGYSDFWKEPSLMGAVAQQQDKIWTAEEALGYVQQNPLPAGVRSYSNTNYIMLGLVIEEVTKVPVEDHFRERFFGPLGLESMYLAGQDDIVKSTDIAAPHDNLARLGMPAPDWVINISFVDFTGIASLAFTSGGIISNVADLAEWGSALFGGKATSPEVLEMMINSIDTEPDVDGDYLGYGLWRTTRIRKNETFIGHDGNAPGYRSLMFYQPDKKLTIAILSNDRGTDPYPVASALYEVLLKEFFCSNNNRKEDKVRLCFKGKMLCVDPSAAQGFVNKGATLGMCETAAPEAATDALTTLRAYPNPVDNRTVISFVPEQSGQVSLRLFDVSGNLKSVLFEGAVQKGMMKQVMLERGALKGGIYFVRLQTAAGISQHKLVLNR